MKLLFVILWFAAIPYCVLAHGARINVREIIFDTDWWTDVDDAVSIRILAKFVHQKQIKLKGVVIDAINNQSVASLDAFLTHEGLLNIPTGADKHATDFTGSPSYHTLCINADTRSGHKTLKDVEDCVPFYRHLLASVSDRKPIEIICVGYTNALSRLLDSPADSISPLSGVELVQKKVRQIWMMAGTYPSGTENNFTRTARSRKAGANVCLKCPVPICFHGFEVGESVHAGGHLPEGDLLRQLLYAHGGAKEAKEGRSAWDPMTVLLACIGNPRKAGYIIKKGTNRVDSVSGRNIFTLSESGSHAYVIKKKNDTWYERRLNKLLRQEAQPFEKQSLSK